MKIVIDIPKDDFEKIKNISFVENTETMIHQSSEDRKGTMMLFRVMDAIKEGTPLPKGHGRLIDADVDIKGLSEMNVVDEKDKQSVRFATIVLENAPTIIEADEGSESK